jgi:hypothetical protein
MSENENRVAKTKMIDIVKWLNGSVLAWADFLVDIKAAGVFELNRICLFLFSD